MTLKLRTVYNQQLLQSIIKRDNCIIKYENYNKLIYSTDIGFICECGQYHTRTFSNLASIGAFCTMCARQRAIIKRRNTVLEKYGVENPMQNACVQENFSKKSKTYKDYIMPCGQSIKIQGYENTALDILFKQYHYASKDIIVSKLEVPSIWYLHEGRSRRYFPDIFVKPQNKIIEVKSEWTYNADTLKNTLKKEACIRNEYDFEFWIFGPKNTLKIQK